MSDLMPAPAFYSYISYRRESFGGFLFNPYLQTEMPLTPAEFTVAELIDGRRTGEEIVRQVGHRFAVSDGVARQQTESALEKFAGYYAVRQRLTPPSTAPADHSARACPSDYREFTGPMSAENAPHLSAPLSVLWETTHGCNLGCLHCLSSCGEPLPDELTTAEALAFIDTLADMRVFSITLGGGEPLTRPDLFDLIARATEKNLGIRLSTNGYAVTKETLRRLAGLNVFSVQISVDGLEKTHDYLRGRPGSFRHAVKALSLFVDGGYHTFMTVAASAANVAEIPELVDLAVSMGVSTFKVSPCALLGRTRDNIEQVGLSAAKIRRLALLMLERQSVSDGKINFQLDGLFPWLLASPTTAPTSPVYSDSGPGCSAGISQAVVSYTGEVYPCPYIREESAGNLRRSSLRTIWDHPKTFAELRMFEPTRIKGKCRGCRYRPTHCQGGCRGAAFAATGDMYAPDPNCWMDS